MGLPFLQAGAGAERVIGEGRRLACLWKLCTPLSFHPQLEEMEKLRKVLTPKVRDEPTCPQRETELLAQPVLPLPCPIKQQDVIVDLRLLGEPLWSFSPGQGMRSQLGLPKHQHFQWKSLPPWGLRCAPHLQGEPPAEQRGGNSQKEMGGGPRLGERCSVMPLGASCQAL